MTPPATLEAIAALPDDALVASCAEKVMGWKMVYSDNQPGGFYWSKGPRTWNRTSWNPLHDENHLALVREHKRAEWAGRKTWDITDLAEEGWNVIIWGDRAGGVVDVCDPSLARAVVIAAVADSLGVSG